MTWNYWNLKFTDKTTADAILYVTGIFGVEPKYDNIDVIGTIAGKTGWHVNIAVQGALPAALVTYKIPFPATPERVFFVATEGVM